MQLSITEENYLKAIYKLSKRNTEGVNNQALASLLEINPASVTDMIKRLEEKRLIDYSRSHGALLTHKGLSIAVAIVRKHRLWETFLVNKMNFGWDEVHEVAEQLEHIQSNKLLDELDKFLGFPKFDPHGDPIPAANGKLPVSKSKPLADSPVGKKLTVVKVTDHSQVFLKYLDKQGIGINDTLVIREVQDFDQSVLVELKSRKEIFLSREASKKIFVEPASPR